MRELLVAILRETGYQVHVLFSTCPVSIQSNAEIGTSGGVEGLRPGSNQKSLQAQRKDWSVNKAHSHIRT